MKQVFKTKTMARLLIGQGERKKAERIIRDLSKKNPDDLELLTMLHDLQDPKNEIKSRLNQAAEKKQAEQVNIGLPKPKRMDLVSEAVLWVPKDNVLPLNYKKIKALKNWLRILHSKS